MKTAIAFTLFLLVVIFAYVSFKRNNKRKKTYLKSKSSIPLESDFNFKIFEETFGEISTIVKNYKNEKYFHEFLKNSSEIFAGEIKKNPFRWFF